MSTVELVRCDMCATIGTGGFNKAPGWLTVYRQGAPGMQHFCPACEIHIRAAILRTIQDLGPGDPVVIGIAR